MDKSHQHHALNVVRRQLPHRFYRLRQKTLVSFLGRKLLPISFHPCKCMNSWRNIGKRNRCTLRTKRTIDTTTWEYLPNQLTKCWEKITLNSQKTSTSLHIEMESEKHTTQMDEQCQALCGIFIKMDAAFVSRINISIRNYFALLYDLNISITNFCYIVGR